MRMTIIILAVVLLLAEGIGWLVQWLIRRKEKEPAETKTAADLPWWLPTPFLTFRPAAILVCFGLVSYTAVACVFGYDEQFGISYFHPNVRFLFFWSLLILLLPWIPDLLYETGRLFSRRRILFAPRGNPSFRKTLLLGIGFLLVFLCISFTEVGIWFLSDLLPEMGRFFRFHALFTLFDLVSPLVLLLSCSFLSGILVWTASCSLFRFRSVLEADADAKPRDVDVHLSIAVLRAFSIPTALAFVTMVFSILVFPSTYYVVMDVFLYGWMVGLHCWMATVPLMLCARKAISWWGCALALGALAVMPVVVLFR